MLIYKDVTLLHVYTVYLVNTHIGMDVSKYNLNVLGFQYFHLLNYSGCVW